MAQQILNASYDLLMKHFISKVQDSWMGELYEYCVSQGTGQMERLKLEPGIELVIMRNCSHQRLAQSLPYSQKNMLEITALVHGEIEMRYHPNATWENCNATQLIYFDWSKPLPYYDFRSTNVSGVSLYVNINEITPHLATQLDVEHMMSRIFQGQRIFICEALPIHRAITSQLLVPYQENIMSQFMIKARALEFLSHSMHINTNLEQSYCSDERIREIKEKIDTHYYEALQVNQLAADYHIPKFDLQNQFKQIYGYTVYRYIQKRRMEAASEKLLLTTASITTIACDVGYDNPSKFSYVFKRLYGITPLQYRRKHRLS